MINPKSDTASLLFIKRALLSHLNSVSLLIQSPVNSDLTGIDLSREYTQTTNLLDDIEILLNRRIHAG